MNRKLRTPWHGEPLGWAWKIVIGVLYLPFSFAVKIRYRNMDRIPQAGPAIFVTNHVSHVDPFLVAKFLIDAGRRPRFLAKESIFDVPVVGRAMSAMGHIPVRRGSADARHSLAPAVDALRRGGIIVLHPEGTVTRDPDGWPMTGKTGAARLVSLVPDVPVIPLAQWGVQHQIDLYAKKVKLFPRPRHVISVGEPIDLSEFTDAEPTARTLHRMTDVIMRRLRSDVAELREVAAPEAELFRWVRPTS